jgi:hypothetical protein
MLSLQNFISVNESLDTENLQYKIDIWFEKNPELRGTWDSLISKVKENHGSISNENFDEYYSNFNCVKEFVDFLTDNLFPNMSVENVIDQNNVVDYSDIFKTIIKYIATL